MKRQEGYYWIKISQSWRIAEWLEHFGYWYMCGSVQRWNDDDFDEINEEQIKEVDV